MSAPTLYSSATWGSKNEFGNKVYPVHEYQGYVLNSKSRFTAAIAGTGGGKTAVGALWSYNAINNVWNKFKKPSLGMIVAPTYKVLERATVPALLETFADTPLEGRYHKHLSYYETAYGDKIWCQGADNPGGLEGGQFDWVWGDEAGQFHLTVWDALQGRTGAKRSPILFTTTPYAFNWLFNDFYQRWKSGDQDYNVVQWNSIENPTYSREEYERAKRTLTPDKFKMRYQGRFERLEGMVYPNINKIITDVTIEEILSKEGRIVGGMDFGWNDPYCAVLGLLEDSTDILWVFYERYLPETTIESHADALPKFLDRRPVWFCDHQPEYILKMRRGGHVCRPANKAIIPGIDAVNARINTGRLLVSSQVTNKRSPAFLVEGMQYYYKNKDGTFIGDKPDPECEDHACDAYRYMVAGCDIKKAA